MAIDPIRRYEVKGDVSPLLCDTRTLAVANNNQLVPAIVASLATGILARKIRVMGWIIQGTTGVAPAVLYKSASAGTTICNTLTFPTNAQASDKLPIFDSGYFETNSAEGLFCDVTLAPVSIATFYITYVP